MSRAVRIDTAIPAGVAVRVGPAVRVAATGTGGRVTRGIRPIAATSLPGPARVPARTRQRVAASSREPLHRRSTVAPRGRSRAGGTTWRQMAATIFLTAVATTLLLVLAHVRTGEVISQSAGTAVAVVQEGETLEALAFRLHPDVPVDVTVARIAELNSLGASGARAGSRLLVPDPVRG
ncbi:LysM peptidoglycan-binding domain-containing protein [Rhodococcus sp. NPDC047139]|uniref:LysM peptidoglycan-binding domain-containing protein n=1 Tax=Rhodococcus sp. NPDC047139 TaxID=3155141 RepID=UPI0033C016E2